MQGVGEDGVKRVGRRTAMPHEQLIAFLQRELVPVNHIVGGVGREVDIFQDVGAGDAVDYFGGYGEIGVSLITQQERGY